MKYLVKLLSKVNDKYCEEIERSGGVIEYKSVLLPLIILTHNNIGQLNNLNFIESIEPDIIGELESNYPIETRPTLNFEKIAPYFSYKNIKVAVIDSGIDNMKMLNVIDFINFTSEQSNQIKHGTGVAMIINQVVPQIKILNAKITDSMEVKMSDAIRAMEWAYLKGANVINLSMGFIVPRCKGTCNICQLTSALKQKNVLVVAAAGNDGPSLGSIRCPGNSPDALTVGAVGLNANVIPDFSSRGRINQNKPDLVTSGYIYNKVSKELPEGGTSFAAPVISGISSGLFGIYNNNGEIKNIVKSCTEKMGSCYKQHDEGNGKFSIDKLVEVLKYEKASGKD